MWDFSKQFFYRTSGHPSGTCKYYLCDAFPCMNFDWYALCPYISGIKNLTTSFQTLNFSIFHYFICFANFCNCHTLHHQIYNYFITNLSYSHYILITAIFFIHHHLFILISKFSLLCWLYLWKPKATKWISNETKILRKSNATFTLEWDIFDKHKLSYSFTKNYINIHYLQLIILNISIYLRSRFKPFKGFFS